MPRTEAEGQAEHQRLEDAETAASVAAGAAQWQPSGAGLPFIPF
jgi:hypothetical protein